MSDEFLKIATSEINDEISEISKILNSCSNDEEIHHKSKDLQSHTHKIKGLAPMMGKEELGSVCAMLDMVMKKINEGDKVEGILDILSDSLPFMVHSMNVPGFDMKPILEKITHFSSSVK